MKHKIRKLKPVPPNLPAKPFTIKLLTLDDQPEAMKKINDHTRAICLTKHRYQDLKDAMTAGQRVGHSVYECQCCLSWHLTSREM